jgi:imidazolonepropionase-like amidohydrolase
MHMLRGVSRTLGLGLVLGLVLAPRARAQRQLPNHLRQFVAVDAPVVAIIRARLVDGTGTPARDDMTVVIQGEKITHVGKTGSVEIPTGAQVVDAAGHTVIPGIVGLHDHMYYSSAAGGSMKMMMFSYPRLFLGNGITTIRTAGSTDSYQELNLKAAIERGVAIGPELFVTGPYLQGGTGLGPMHPVSGPEDARRMVRYWAQEGVSWFKAYTQISRADLGAAIDEAHKHGVKVTAHLCSVGYREAVSLGIDNLEHGLFANSEYVKGKQPDVCPQDSDSSYLALDVHGADAKRTIDEMVKRNVSMTSTLSVFETGTPSRVKADQRVLDALMPEASAAVARWYESGKTANDSVQRMVMKRAMDFERAFAKAGGLLAAGSDPCCLHAIAGYSDQRNYELLVEAGFTPEEAVQIMTANGAKVLGIADRVGTVAVGKQADLVMLRGDPTRTPSDIRNVVTVFRKGLGFDSAKLIASVKGQVGIK